MKVKKEKSVEKKTVSIRGIQGQVKDRKQAKVGPRIVVTKNPTNSAGNPVLKVLLDSFVRMKRDK